MMRQEKPNVPLGEARLAPNSADDPLNSCATTRIQALGLHGRSGDLTGVSALLSVICLRKGRRMPISTVFYLSCRVVGMAGLAYLSSGQAAVAEGRSGRMSNSSQNAAAGKSLSVTLARSKAPCVASVKADMGRATFFGGVQLDFGDGATTFLCMPGQACGRVTLEHRYEKAGRYIVKIVGVGEGAQQLLAKHIVVLK